MEKEKFRICWNITPECNSNCEYCHRFNVEKRKFNDNKKILKKMIKDGITNITWSGGEALLYPHVTKLMKIAKENGIINKLITNGTILSNLKDKNKDKILDNLDTIVLSIDTVDNETNSELGRGFNHYDEVKEVLEYAKNKDIKLDINTVITKKNSDKIEDLAKFLNGYDINIWKFFKFMPFRELAEQNREMFEIEDEDVEKTVKKIENMKLENINEIYYKTEKLVEEDIVLDPQANMYQTVRQPNGKFKDEYKGNAMENNIVEAIKASKVEKKQNSFIEGLKVDVEKTNTTNISSNIKEETEKEEDKDSKWQK